MTILVKIMQRMCIGEFDEQLISIEVDGKIQRIEELRTAYRGMYNELKVLLGSNYEESSTEDLQEKIDVSKKLYNESLYNKER